MGVIIMIYSSISITKVAWLKERERERKENTEKGGGLSRDYPIIHSIALTTFSSPNPSRNQNCSHHSVEQKISLSLYHQVLPHVPLIDPSPA